jgi:hypothetical protein
LQDNSRSKFKLRRLRIERRMWVIFKEHTALLD